jgi:hypothetical protein
MAHPRAAKDHRTTAHPRAAKVTLPIVTTTTAMMAHPRAAKAHQTTDHPAEKDHQTADHPAEKDPPTTDHPVVKDPPTTAHPREVKVAPPIVTMMTVMMVHPRAEKDHQTTDHPVVKDPPTTDHPVVKDPPTTDHPREVKVAPPIVTMMTVMMVHPRAAKAPPTTDHPAAKGPQTMALLRAVKDPQTMAHPRAAKDPRTMVHPRVAKVVPPIVMMTTAMMAHQKEAKVERARDQVKIVSQRMESQVKGRPENLWKERVARDPRTMVHPRVVKEAPPIVTTMTAAMAPLVGKDPPMAPLVGKDLPIAPLVGKDLPIAPLVGKDHQTNRNRQDHQNLALNLVVHLNLDPKLQPKLRKMY